VVDKQFGFPPKLENALAIELAIGGWPLFVTITTRLSIVLFPLRLRRFSVNFCLAHELSSKVRLLRHSGESEIHWFLKNWNPGRASLARNDHLPWG